ncbi:STAS domain-containing protein [Actinomadura madurae]|uniref:STAS domain-containing protein n=2 Tax=Actinomadura madurae TaxID=1993 RepID=UPI002026CE8E|nr:STAS domain-containing protein [Actinomadura madurae]MCP9955971.1 STAS domain-containing protein [Actinomadura madurae]MCP9972763.1 STAS domain-containing protein [Actinomadura madurae]MCP9985168.1 STAS domain-containing protein [Actinomadura madurae]MCP9985229.1 STAS domain-containing protein [Actinomadura madurae]MCQ0012411.1 STAS domain-containing protein [Actinomadura madurae]
MTDGSGDVRITEMLRSWREPVLARWVELVTPGIRGRLTEHEVQAELGELYGLVERSLDGDEAASGELRATLAEISRSRARQGFSPRETAISVFALKQALYEQIRTTRDQRAYSEIIDFSAYVDELGLATFETYAAAREQVIADQAEQLLELSTPVVKLWDGVLGVPLVGTLDSARTQVVMETLLQTLVDTGCRFAVIDITGVAAVDTEVAQHLMKTVMAARLMGTHCVISGIRPQIAQTIVTLGIEFGDIVTKPTLADALAYTLAHRGVRVVAGRED